MSNGKKKIDHASNLKHGRQKNFNHEDFKNIAEERCLYGFVTRNDKKVLAVFGLKADELFEISMLYSVARRILHEDFFTIRNVDGQTRVEPTVLYRDCYRYLSTDVCHLRRVFFDQKFNPYVELLINYINYYLDEYIKGSVFPFFNNLDEEKKVYVANMVNEMTAEIRKEATSDKFKRSISSLRDGVNKNARSLNDYIDGLFKIYSKVLVLRLDLGYKKEHAHNITYKSINQHIKKFLKNRSQARLFRDMIGYALKFEAGVEKGLHVHLILFFNGSKAQNDKWYADQVGDYWVNNVTKGFGVYYNCNRFKSNYRGCGIGMVGYEDKVMRKNLEKAAMYLTKADHWIRLVVPEIGRTFRRGELPNSKISKNGKPIGRPRSGKTLTQNVANS